MCGIIGQYSKNPRHLNVSEFIGANSKAAHRGPDGFGILSYETKKKQIKYLNLNSSQQTLGQDVGDLFLGHRRLAIIDISHGADQPLVSEEQDFSIVFNGEIYNYLELRSELISLGYRFKTNSDTEVLLQGYRAWGADIVPRLRGMWAFAILDSQKNSLFCSRDRFGIKPFYYFRDDQNLVFSSEIKQLLAFKFVPSSPNDRVIYDYLQFGILDHSEETFFAEIKRLLPGHNMIVDLSEFKIHIEKYYEPRFKINEKISFAEASKGFAREFKESLNYHLVSDVEVASLLSGGLDSSAIVSMASKYRLANPVRRVFSSQSKEKEANEFEYARIIADHYKIEMITNEPKFEDFLQDMENLVKIQDEPFGSTSIYAQYAIFRNIQRHHIKVVLDGQGADEMLAGYFGFFPSYADELKSSGRYFKWLWENLKHLRANPETFYKKIFSSRFKKQNTSRANILNTDFSSSHSANSIYLQNLKEQAFSSEEKLNNILHSLFFRNNLPALLRYEDHNSMAFSVESRVPFVDHKLVEFCFSLPSRFKIRNGFTKAVLRQSMAGILPRKVRYRLNKLGFATPETKWMGQMENRLRDALKDPRMKKYINPIGVQDYYDVLMKHQIKDFTIWRVINLHLWLETLSQRERSLK